MDRLSVNPRDELQAILDENPGTWFRVSYNVRKNSDGTFDVDSLQAEKQNKESHAKDTTSPDSHQE